MKPNFNESVHYPAWIPQRHPMSGQRINVLCNVLDRIVGEDECRELEAQFDLPAAPGSLSLKGTS